jgi:hypothetical protein
MSASTASGQFGAGVLAPGQQLDRLLAQFIRHGIDRDTRGNCCSTRCVSPAG